MRLIPRFNAINSTTYARGPRDKRPKPAPSPIELGPGAFQPLVRHGKGGLQLLRKERYLQFLEQPAKVREAWLRPPRAPIAFGALTIALPPFGHALGVLRVARRIVRMLGEAPREALEISREVGEMRPRRCAEESRIHEGIAPRPHLGA